MRLAFGQHPFKPGEEKTEESEQGHGKGNLVSFWELLFWALTIGAVFVLALIRGDSDTPPR